MSTASAKDLFVLGRISLRPTYGHEIMRTLRESHADLWIDLSEKHVYYILKKLDRDGLVSVSEDGTGSLPRRRVYAITDAGLSALAEMMTAENLVEAIPYSEFDVLLGMLCYTDSLADEAKSAILLKRRSSLERTLGDLARVSEDSATSAGVGGFPAAILTRVTHRLADELAWLNEIAAQVERDGWQSMRPAFEPASE